MKIITSILLLLLAVVSSTAEQIVVRDVSELINPSAVIARATITCVMETYATEGYTKIAYAQVSDPIKGVEAGRILEIENDTAGIVCPNVRYAEGEDVLVFAKPLPNGHYHTTYASTGKFLIKNGNIDQAPFGHDIRYEVVRKQIKRELNRIARVTIH